MTTNKRNRKEREKRTHSQRKEGERRGGEQMQERRERRERERERRKGVPPKGHVTHPCEFLLRAEADLDQKKTREGTKGGERGAQRGGGEGANLETRKRFGSCRRNGDDGKGGDGKCVWCKAKKSRGEASRNFFLEIVSAFNHAPRSASHAPLTEKIRGYPLTSSNRHKQEPHENLVLVCVRFRAQHIFLLHSLGKLWPNGRTCR